MLIPKSEATIDIDLAEEIPIVVVEEVVEQNPAKEKVF
jgi:hypothetical protein